VQRYKSRSGEDFKSTCQLLAMLIDDDMTYFELPQCEVLCQNPNAASDFAHLEQFTKHIATKAKDLQQLHLKGTHVPLLRSNSVARNIFTRQLIQMRNLRVLHVMPLMCNSDSLKLIASHMLLLT
jgi:hypothetical protein